jgi:hypothetical protein
VHRPGAGEGFASGFAAGQMKTLRVLALALLAANLLLFGYGAGYFGAPPGGVGEPERVANQIAAERIRVVGPGEASGPARSAPPVEPPTTQPGPL